MSFTEYLCINLDEVDAAAEKAENALTAAGKTIFSLCGEILEREGKNVSFYVNGRDSHLYVEGEEVW